jgi:deoxycytidine triphosphate deaminase
MGRNRCDANLVPTIRGEGLNLITCHKGWRVVMLAKLEVEKLIVAKEITIAYSFLETAEKQFSFVGEELVNPDVRESLATKLFEKNYFCDRLNLTLGPIVRSHNYTKYSGRKIFKTRPGYYDIRDTDGFFLQPNEVISVATNERIALKGKIGATILPRLTTVDAGLVYIPTYIDPYWNGILQGVIVNIGSQPIRLDLCEKIAICRFYRIDGVVDPQTEQQFPAKSHHFGNNWNKIINEEVDPLPRRKEPYKVEKIRGWIRFLDNAKSYWKKIVGIGLSGSVICGALWICYTKYQDFSSKLDRIPFSGTVDISIEPGKSLASKEITVARSARDTQGAWVAPEGSADDIEQLTARFSPDPQDPAKTTVTIVVRMR